MTARSGASKQAAPYAIPHIRATRCQEVETRIAVTILNRMFDLGRPNSVRAA